MKSKNILWASVASLLLLASCERELVPYSDPTCRINFCTVKKDIGCPKGILNRI